MAKKLLCIITIILALICFATSCGDDSNTQNNTEHTHTFGEWETVKEATPTEKGSETRKCSCGEVETRDTVYTVKTVTESEWKNAFDLSKYASLTITGKEYGSEDGIDFNFNATIKYYGGLLYVSFDGPDSTGNTTMVSYFEEPLKDFATFSPTDGFDALANLLSKFEDLGDFGYSRATYSVSDKSYQVVDDSGRIYKFWFEDGKLVKYYHDKIGQVEYLTCTYTITDYNSTERFSIPTQSVKADYQKVVSSISSSTKFYYYDDNYEKVYVDAAAIKSELNSMKIDVTEVYAKGMLNGKINYFKIQTRTISSSEKILYLYVKKGEIKSISIGYYSDEMTTYYVEK